MHRCIQNKTMGLFSNIGDKIKFGERWAGRRLGDFSKIGKKVADFTGKAAKKVGQWSGKAAEGLAVGAIAGAGIPGASEVLGTLAGAAEGVSLGAGLVTDASKGVSKLADKGIELSNRFKKNENASRYMT